MIVLQNSQKSTDCPVLIQFSYVAAKHCSQCGREELATIISFVANVLIDTFYEHMNEVD